MAGLTREEVHRSRQLGAIRAAETRATSHKERSRPYRNGKVYRDSVTVLVTPEIYQWLDEEAEKLNIPTRAHARNLLWALYEAAHPS